MAEKTVTITVSNDGDFTYDPSFVRVRPGDKVTFKNDDEGPFEVVFKDRSPGDKLYLWNRSATLTISPRAALGLYHYAVAVSKGKRVFVDPSSGDIGVRD